MAAPDLVRRAVRASGPVRLLIKHPIAQQVIQTERAARVLRPAPRFVRSQLAAGIGAYVVPSGATVHIRHRTRDVAMVNEIFGATGGRLQYEPPRDVAAELEGRPLRVFDLGGNIGMFGAFALGRWPLRELLSFEPDPQNAELLRATIASNGVGYWRLHPVAVSNCPGTMQFVTGQFSESRQATSAEEAGVAVNVIDLFALDHRVDLLKMDIEGGEWAILTDPRLATLGARVIVMEWHWRFCPEADSHAAVRRLLAAAGYELRLDAPSEDRQTGVLWAVRRP